MTKHLHKLCALVLVCCAFLGSNQAWGQVQYEPFATTGSLTNMSGWANTSGTAGQLQIVGGNLTYANLPAPEGNKLTLKSTDSEDAKLTLASPATAGTVYASFLFKPESGLLPNNSSTGNYFFHLVGGGNQFVSRVSIREGSAANTFNLGVYRVSGGTATAADVFGANPANYAIGSTYLAVVSYDLSTNTSKVWLNPVVGEAETAPLHSSTFGTGLPTEVAGIAIRQSNSGGLGTGNMEIDEIRVGTTWASVTPASTAAADASLSLSTGSINFGDVLIGSSSIASYQLTGSNLPSGKNITLTATGAFEISNSENGNFTNSINIPSSELASAKTIYVKATPTTEEDLAGTVLHKMDGAADAVLNLVVKGATPFNQDFTNCSNSIGISGGWSQYSVTGDQTWACTTFGKEGNGVQMSGYSSGNKENVDWLISPKLDISNFVFPLLSIDYRTKFAGEALVIKVSTDYTGTGNPTAATWTTLASLPADEADAWKTLEDLSLGAFKSENTYVAFVYTSTSEGAPRWTLDNFELENEDNYLTTSNPVMYFAETAVGEATAPQQFTFKAEGYSADVVLTAPNHFELSKNGTDFTSTLSYMPTEAANQNTVSVRFKPTSAVAMVESSIAFTSSDKLNTTAGKLIGSSILKVATLDVATWNLEWFGSTSNGPSDDQLQFENAKRALTELNADIVAFQEITDEAKARELAQELGYNYISKKMDWQGSNDQVVAFMYNPQVATVKKEKVVLKKLYEDIQAGRTTLTGYPKGNSNLLWASGRLPYMVQFEVTIGDTKQLYNLVNIHAKANSGDDMEQYDRRKYDVQVLKDSLDAQYADANVILLGDFNDDVDVSVVGTNNPSTYNMFVTDNKYVSLTYDLSLTGAATYESGSLKSFLDHQIISKSLEDEYIANSIRIESQLLENITNFRSTTSDHLPVTARFFISSDVTTGIAKATKGMFRVYPNPFMTHIRLELPARVAMLRSISLSVYGLEGRKLKEFKGTQEEVQQQLNDSISKLNKGMYILKIQAGSEFFQTRMLKQ